MFVSLCVSVFAFLIGCFLCSFSNHILAPISFNGCQAGVQTNFQLIGKIGSPQLAHPQCPLCAFPMKFSAFLPISSSEQPLAFLVIPSILVLEHTHTACQLKSNLPPFVFFDLSFIFPTRPKTDRVNICPRD